MKKNRWFLRMLALLAICGALSGTMSLAAEAGSDQDPLVTLSYLNETFLNNVLARVDEKIAARNAQITQQLGGQATSTAVFSVVTLSSGQTLTGGIGCEVMLRVGSAVCVASSAPGLVDETTGATLGGGSALSQNHLYMMTVEGRGVKAGAATVKLLVRGTYTIA
ncbi:hypothetical protein [Oscillibacter sp.]|uniref:hypothetical protein n=1 Tax=Oscillibacter sp. TaxID=1945593 RepID=UPI0026310CCA|nr:hypothetical protein [Oscillibacter sp.]MDD3346234.1 hypothetical protein [Oscillibacter sp.]